MPRLTTYSDGYFIDFHNGHHMVPTHIRQATALEADLSMQTILLTSFSNPLVSEKPRHLDDGLLLQHQLGHGPVEPDVLGWLRH